MASLYPGVLGFVLSAVLLCWTSALIASCVKTEARGRFWIFVASMAIHLGVISEATSLFEKLDALAWLGLQFLFFIVIVILSKQVGRSAFDTAGHTPKGITEYIETWLVCIRSIQPSMLVLSLFPITLIFLSGLEQYLTPISNFDERMYHASRVLYWLQNQSIFPYLTHNDRQVVFGFGGELFFLWPVLFTKTELIGRMIFWSGYPIAAIGLYSLLRELEASSEVSVLGTFVFTATPIVYKYSVGLKPELWLVVFVLGAAFWTVKACKNTGAILTSLFFAALFLLLSINVKSTAMALAPPVFALPWLTRGNKSLAKKIGSIAYGALTGLLLSGLLITTEFNLAKYGSIFGPQSLRKLATSDISAKQIYTHTVRFTFLLLEFPAVPIPAVRNYLSNLGNDIISFLGAGAPLPLENKHAWPGFYVYTLPGVADNFSLGGLVWLPLLLISLKFLLRDLISTYPRIQLRPLSGVVLLEGPLLFGVVFLIRWMPTAGLPERYLLPAYALGLAVNTVLLSRFIGRARYAPCVAVVLVMLMVPSALRLQTPQVWKAISLPVRTELLDEPFAEALKHIPEGSHILLVGSQAVRDYPLFAPRNGYSNTVVPWGKLPFDANRMRELIKANAITHVLVENDRSLGFHWDPPISTREMVNWLRINPNLVEIKLNAPEMRLFQTNMAGRPNLTDKASAGVSISSDIAKNAPGLSAEH